MVGAVSRRTVLATLAAGPVLTLPGCSTPFADTRLRLATGSERGVYYRLGSALARTWQAELGLTGTPIVLSTAGSVQNVALLAAGAADVVFSQVDAAAERLVGLSPDAPDAPRALARIYDDVLHVVVPATSPITTVSGLRGARVSVGATDSGVSVVAGRLLDAAGLGPAGIRGEQLGLDASVEAMAAGVIDAFFWSGGLPTGALVDYATSGDMVLIPHGEHAAAMQAAYGEYYTEADVPADTYDGQSEAVSVVVVPNVLVANPDNMSEDLQERITAAIYDNVEQLTQVHSAAADLDPSTAGEIEFMDVCPGSMTYFDTQ